MNDRCTENGHAECNNIYAAHCCQSWDVRRFRTNAFLNQRHESTCFAFNSSQVAIYWPYKKACEYKEGPRIAS